MKANKFIQKGKPDHTAEFTVFGQIFQYFKNIGYSSFRCTKDTNPFSVQFIGEAAIDVGGNYLIILIYAKDLLNIVICVLF
jgi:hypothetical protein